MQIPNRLNNIQQIEQRLRQDQPGSTNSSEPANASPSPEASVAGEVLRELRASPELRSDVIDRARQRVASGEYLTSAVAQATANALLNAG